MWLVLTKKQSSIVFIKSLLSQAVAIFLMLLFWRAAEFVTVPEARIPPDTPVLLFLISILQGMAAATGLYLISFGLIVSLVRLISRLGSRLIYSLAALLTLLIYISATQFFYTTRLLLDKVIFYFSWKELKLIIQSETGTAIDTYLWFYIFCSLILAIFIFLRFRKKEKANPRFSALQSGLGIFIGILIISFYAWPVMSLNNSTTNIARSKTEYFAQSVLRQLIPRSKREMRFEDVVAEYRDFNYLNPISSQDEYPLIHKFDPEKGDISKFFKKFDGPPSVVMVFCEGLSSSFSGPGARYGSMTPHLDSLYAKGLYWPNALSNTDRTHGIFANALASMPHGFERGMTNLRIKPYPQHFSLPKLLVSNGYDAGFMYGGWAYFDNYEPYLRKNYVDKIFGQKFWEENYNAKAFQQSPEHSWGIPDIPFFKLYFKLKPEDRLEPPYLGIFLNESLHSPFKIPNQKKYIARAREKYLESHNDPEFFERYTDKWATIYYMDEAIGNFMRQYRQRPEYQNTIFIFVGDHNFFGFPINNELDIHNVPLVIFSPKLKEAHTFKDIVAHTDLPASLVKLLSPYLPDPIIPEYSNWMSPGLSTTDELKATRPIYLGTFSGTIQGVVRSDTLFINDRLYQISGNMEMNQIRDADARESFENALDDYRAINKYVIEKDKLILDPDSNYLNHAGAFFFGK